MRIGMLCHYYPPHPGGVEIVVWNLARELARRNEVSIVTCSVGSNAGTTIEDGITVHRTRALNVTEHFGIPYPIPMGRGLATAVKSLASFDVLHAHGALYPGSIYAARLGREYRLPLVLTEHVGFVQYPSRLVNAVESAAWASVGSRVIGASRAVVTINARIERWLRERYPSSDIRFIGNGVDTTRFAVADASERAEHRRAFGLPDEKPLVLFAGRDSDKKNLDAVLAMPRDAFHLVVCGARRGLRGAGLTDLGIIPYDQMPRLFGAVDLMIQASTGEGFPLVVQEALATGVAIAILWDPGYATSLDRNVVSACDTVDELAHAVNALAANEGLRRRLARDGRAWAERRWSWEATARDYESLYAAVARERKKLAA